MKAFNRIMLVIACIVFMFFIWWPMVSYTFFVTKEVELCKTNGGKWVKIPSGTEYLPGGLPKYKCNKD